MSGIVRSPFLRVVVNGNTINTRFSASCSFGFDQRTARALIDVPTVPEGVQAWQIVEIHMGASQGSGRLRFKGLLVDINHDLWPRAVTLDCRGELFRAEFTRNGDDGGMSFAASGAGTPDEDQVTTVLSECGVTDMDIEGTGIPIGSFAIDQVIWEEGQTGLSYIERLDEVCMGYRTYDGLGGTVLRRKVSPRPSTSAALTFTEGVDIFSAQRRRTPVDIRNRVLVTGYDKGDGAVFAAVQQEQPALPPGVQWVTMELSSDLVERTDQGSAGVGLTARDVAEWRLLEANVLKERVPFSTPRDDLIVPGQTIQVQSPDRLGTTANYWVQNVTCTYSNSGEFSQSITAIGGPGSDSDIIAPPLIDFTFRVELELVYIDGNLEPIWVVFAEDASVGQSAEIVSRDWTIPGGNPASGEGITFVTALESLSGAELTLTIEDSNGIQASRTKSVDVPDAEIKRRRVYTAAETVAEAFDGGEWRTAVPGNAAAVSEVGHGPIWIAGDRVYRSQSLLADGMQSSVPFGDEVGEGDEKTIVPNASPTAVWVELDVDANLVMAGSSDGRVAFSTDAGASWEDVRDGPRNTPVVRCVISRFNPNHIYAMYAESMWESHDQGRDWQQLVSAHPGETFRDLNVSFERMMIGMTGGRFLIDGRNDHQQILPALDPPITEIPCVTADIRQDRFYAIDALGRTFATIEPGSIEFEQRVSVPEGTTPQWRGLWRDGDIPGLLYMALGTGGVWKHISGFSFTEGYYQMRAPGAGNSPANAIHRRVGLDGVFSEAPAPGRVFLLGLEGIASRISRNQWMRVNDPTTAGGRTYKLIIAARGNPERLYVLTNQGLIFRSTNGGQHWTELAHGIGSMGSPGSWISPGNDEMTIWAGASGGGGTSGLWRTVDGGDSWSAVWPIGNIGGTGVSAHQVRDFGHRIWWGGLGGGTVRWIRYTDNNFGSVVVTGFSGAVGGLGGRFAVSRDAPGTAYHWRQVDESRLERWREGSGSSAGSSVDITPSIVGLDGGVRWAEAVRQNTVLCVAGFGSGNSAVFRSINQGDSWSQVLSDPVVSYESPTVAVNPDMTTEWWVAATLGRVFQSTDDGQTWESEVHGVSGLGAIRQIMVAGGNPSD